MVLSDNSSTDTALSAHRPVLLEGSSALDRVGVLTGGLVDLVGSVVAVNGAELSQARGGVVVTVLVDDVEFDQGRGGPAVDGQVGVGVGFPRSAVGNGPE